MKTKTQLSTPLTELTRNFCSRLDRGKKRDLIMSTRSHILLVFCRFLLPCDKTILIVTLSAMLMAGTIPINNVFAITETQKLTASDGEAGDNFGRPLSISGDTAIVSAVRDDNSSGSVYIFEKSDDGVWAEKIKLTASDGEVGDSFGQSVSISGNTAIVGAHLDDDACPSIEFCNSGSAYIFTRSGNGLWSEQKITASDAAESIGFGRSVSISGDTAIVGAGGTDDVLSSAYIFTRSNDDGLWREETKLTASDAAANNSFGGSVSISGNTVIIGASSDDESSGAAYIFIRSDEEVWSELAKIKASDAARPGEFGRSVSISDDTAIIGANGDDDNGRFSGAAYIFTRSDDGIWSEQAKLTASDGEKFDELGRSVSISGDTAIVGATDDSDKGNHSGSAYVFTRSGDGVWSELAKLTASDGARLDSFGNGVSISGGTAIVGAVCDDDNGSCSGSAYIYNIITNNPDVTPPTLGEIPDIVIKATGPDGVRVDYQLPEVEDDTDPNPIVVCNPSSGSIFPKGSSMVTCIATDADGNEAATSFTVRVVSETEAPLRFTPIADATIKFDAPTENFGADREVQTDNRPMRDFLIKFDVLGIGTRHIQSAKLRLFCTNKSDQGGDFHPVDNDWSEDTVTWDNAPPEDPEVIASLGPVARLTWVEVDLTSLITEDGVYSLRVMSPSKDGADYRSKEKVDLASELIITLTDMLTFAPTADATIKSNSPTENFGASQEVEADNRPLEDFLMKFDVSGIGTGTVTRAILRLFCNSSSEQGGDFHLMDEKWSEDTVTWDNAPLADREVIASLGPVVKRTWVEVDLTSLITEDSVYSFRVMSSSKDGADYRSKEKAGLAPELTLTLE